MTKIGQMRGKAVAAILWTQENVNAPQEILMTKRRLELKTFPGYWAFPGGKIDEGESAPQALTREIWEEVGLKIDASRAISHGAVTTPKVHPYRFNTQYFSVQISLEEKKQIEEFFNQNISHPEFIQHEWKSAEKHLAFYQQGVALMVPPVRHFLASIVEMGMVHAQMLELDHVWLEDHFFPLEVQSGVMQLFIPSPTLPPHTDTNCFIFGAEYTELTKKEQLVMLVDPSPKDELHYKKMLAVLDHLKLVPEKIVCTHHHGDHCAFLDETAEHFRVPVLSHPKTWELALASNAEKWQRIAQFRQDVVDGDVVGLWKNKVIKVVHVPGHDVGQIALTTDQGDFFIAGDLFQSEGSVVIGGRGSSMGEYMQTLYNLVNNSPQILYPSHGIAIGGVYAIKRLIKHRLGRHLEVIRLQNMGKNLDEITGIIYHQLDASLMKYARANVESHLIWNQQESLEHIQEKFHKYL